MSLNEHIKKILDKSTYLINEAKYDLVMDEFENDDNIPEEIWSGPQPITGGDSNVFEDDEDDEKDPNGEFGDEETPDDTIPSPDVDVSTEPIENPTDDEFANPEDVAVEPELEPQPSVDELQNDIIKLNISAMQKMNSRVDELGTTLDTLYAKIDELDRDVEEVREPTNVEKLVSRKNDSHPYYHGLNDMWDGNWFQARQDGLEQKGMKQLEDGSYVADFDSLNKFTDQEIKDSFDI